MNPRNSQKFRIQRKERLESLLRVLRKFKQSGIQNQKFTMTQLNQKIEYIEKAIFSNERLIQNFQKKNIIPSIYITKQ